jgi:hypothetical protein
VATRVADDIPCLIITSFFNIDMKTTLYASLMMTWLLATSCGDLSSEAKQIVGNYIIPEISQTEPVMELKRDATCVVRAIKPGVLSYSVEGTWNVENDSLVMALDRSTLKAEGDTLLIGDIPARSARRIVEFSDFSLQLENGGVVYYYKRIKN